MSNKSEEIEIDYIVVWGKETLPVKIIAEVGYHKENDSFDHEFGMKRFDDRIVYDGIKSVKIYEGKNEFHYGSLPDDIREEIESEIAWKAAETFVLYEQETERR